ncbi:MAG: hypothetical protein JNK46_17480 [Methylobacteriaceae bacterium]|nr:hypothetical protein [Methylobacteriaceae bacterium]
MGEWLGLLLWLALAAGAPPALLLRDDATRLWPLPFADAAVYKPQTRAVAGWRREAARWLDVAPATRIGFVLGDGADLPRCVRLNNYWCVKRAGWTGEIAADAEGHVAFAAAGDGALVAAALLRRYYVDYARRTATAIVVHWAPADCAATAALGGQPLARRGLGQTVRARWLARNRPGFTGRARPGQRGLRPSVVAARPAPMMRAPAIAVGMGEAAPSARLAALDLLGPATPLRATPPRAGCAADGVRQANYAARLAASAGRGPTDDLGLFDAAGEPTDRLAPALTAMAAVEIGPHAISAELAEDAVERLRELLRKRRE